MRTDSEYLHMALEYFYGYKEFRQSQEEIVREILSQRPVLAILPTGAGKSLCFQLPSLLMPGVTLVVSPLISLMKDQAQALCARDIPAAYLDSSMSGNSYGKVLHDVLQGRMKFLYVAPERLVNPQFCDFARRARITLVAVDEAHCVSQWGKGFRREYYKIPDFIAQLPERPLVAAFTASATPRVRADIKERLQIQQARTFITSFDRPNLHLAVKWSVNKDWDMRDFLRDHAGECGIIYCSTRKKVEEVTSLVRNAGYSVRRYHAGLSTRERSANQEAFVLGEAKIIVATNAFGMGIDKADVRFVLHYNMPKDMEGYYQEAGRAGRDGKPAHCLLLFNSQDRVVNSFLIEKSEADNDYLNARYTMEAEKERKAQEQELLDKMYAFCHSRKCLRQSLLEYFGEQAGPRCNNCSRCDVLNSALGGSKF